MYDRDQPANDLNRRTVFINRFLFVGVFLVFLGIVVSHWFGPPPPPETAEEHSQREARWEQWAQQDRQRAEHKTLCRVASACRTYDTVRLECATAGNFRTCLRIKMGDDVSLLSACTSDPETGAPVVMPPNMPSRAACLF
jgi:hypothetical protein